ncbi:MAG: SDR family oxidoreductase [Cyanobacteria bacterium]|nr:SDR family oxidoreductase [Cyanobacteriota bacterium]
MTRKPAYAGGVAIVTGASQGLGEAIALRLAENGLNLVLTARNQAKLKTLADRIHSLYPQIQTLVCPADVQKNTDVEDVIQQTMKTFGRIDVLINNAGVAAKMGLFQELSVAAIEQTVQTNLLGPMYFMKAVLPVMVAAADASKANERPAGVIININSVAGQTAYPYWSVYDASKFGLRALTEAVAEEQRSNGIRVVGIYPGAVNTAIWDSVDLESVPDRSQMLQPVDIAAAVEFIINQPTHCFVSELTLKPVKPTL